MKSKDIKNSFQENSIPFQQILLETLSAFDKDIYEFSTMVNVSGEESFGEYTCIVSNGIGDRLTIAYTITQDSKL